MSHPNQPKSARDSIRMSHYELRNLPGFASSFDYTDRMSCLYGNHEMMEEDAEEERNNMPSPHDIWKDIETTEAEMHMRKLQKRLQMLKTLGEKAPKSKRATLRRLYRETLEAIKWVQTFSMHPELGLDEPVIIKVKGRLGSRKKICESESNSLLHKKLLPELSKGKFTSGYWFKRAIEHLKLNKQDTKAAWNLWAKTHGRKLKRR